MSGEGELWETYTGAVIECEVDGRTVVLRGAVADRLPAAAPVFVLTAYNPGGIERDSEANERDEARLELELARRGIVCWPADGHSPDRSWSEPGVAIAGADRATACALGDRYGQLAVFELTDDEVRLVECRTRAVVRTRPRAGSASR